MISTKSLFSNAEGLDDRSLEFLTAAIEKNNLPGFDYFEFKRAVATLESMQLDTTMAYKSAFATAATVGVTKEKLIETAAYYRNLVEKENENFAEALANQHQTKVKTGEQNAKRLRDQIERHKSEIQRLQDEMGKYLQEIETAETNVKIEAEKLEKAKTAFNFTNQAVLLQIDQDIENLHKLL